MGGFVMYYNVLENDNCEEFPDSIKKLLKLLKGEKVVIVLRSGQKQTVVVDAVVGDLLMVSVNKCIIKFIDIHCICEVLAERENVFIQKKVTKLRGCADFEVLQKPTQPYGWQIYQNNQKI